jgi:hypothetical protein
MTEDSNIQDPQLSASLNEVLRKSRDSFGTPAGYFESREALIASKVHETLETPVGFFETQQSAILEALEHPTSSKGERIIRLWLPIAAAAMLAGVVYLVWSENRKVSSFAEQLNETPLEYEDLEVIDFDPSVYEEFVEEDTVIADTTQLKKVPQNVNDFKPSKGQSVITWDDIEAEDIEEYLKEEESLNIIDEL